MRLKGCRLTKRFAYNLTRPDVHYRHEVFSAGLAAAGYEVRKAPPNPAGVRPGDLLLIWNRYGNFNDYATLFEKRGGVVIVAENGYIGRDEKDNQLYAMACSGHNGSGSWREGKEDRFTPLGIELQPWREAGKHIVVRGQRGIGSRLMASPPGWARDCADKLRRITKRPVVVVPHPGEGAERDRSHEQYLQGAHALVIWSSSVGVKALAMGVPVFYCAPHWVCSTAAVAGLQQTEQPLMDDAARLDAMHRMSWAQWSLAEVATGRPFKELTE